MDINRENYESWFLYYVEGSLSAGQISQVHQFIEQNPDLERELLSWQETVIQPDLSMVYHDKEDLKKRQRIIPLSWMITLGAVAALIAIVLLAIPLIQNAEVSGESVATAPAPQDMPFNSSAQDGLSNTSSDVILKEENQIANNNENDPVQPSMEVNQLPKPDRQERAEQQKSFAQESGPVETSEPAKTRSSAINSPSPKLQSPEQQSPQQQTPELQSRDRLPETLLADQASTTTDLPLALEPMLKSVSITPVEHADVLADAQLKRIAVQPLSEGPSEFPILTAINDRLPFDVSQVLNVTQSAATGISGFMSGESAWLGNRDRETEETRVFQFSVGGLKIYHRKSPKSAS